MPCLSFNPNQKGIFLQKIWNIGFHINNLGDNIKTDVNDKRMNLLTSLLAHSFTLSITYPPTNSCTHTSLTHSNPAPPVTLSVRVTYMVKVFPERFEVLTPLIIKITVLWDMTPCRLVEKKHAQHWQLSTESHGVTTQYYVI